MKIKKNNVLGQESEEKTGNDHATSKYAFSACSTMIAAHCLNKISDEANLHASFTKYHCARKTS